LKSPRKGVSNRACGGVKKGGAFRNPKKGKKVLGGHTKAGNQKGVGFGGEKPGVGGNAPANSGERKDLEKKPTQKTSQIPNQHPNKTGTIKKKKGLRWGGLTGLQKFLRTGRNQSRTQKKIVKNTRV